MNDYYAILGLTRDASAEEIKKAYRRRCRELHPDVTGQESSDQIKEVNAAYDVLGNPDKRRQYDMGVDPLAPAGDGHGFAGGFGSFSDIFETFFSAAAAGSASARGPGSRRQRGRDQLESVVLELRDAVFGVRHDLTLATAVICGACQGSCCAAGTSPQRCGACGGRGVTQRIVRSLLGDMRTAVVCAQCDGYGDIIPAACPECAGTGRVRARRTIPVDIPPGVGTGTRIRLNGQGEAGPAGGPPGDLFVETRVRRDATFSRDGDNLNCGLTIPMTAAALGTVVDLATFDGPRQVDVRPGTQPGDVVTLGGLGVGRLTGQGRGDLIVHIDVEVPTRLDDVQADLLRQLAALRGEERPEARLAPTGGGVFSKLRDKLAGR